MANRTPWFQLPIVLIVAVVGAPRAVEAARPAAAAVSPSEVEQVGLFEAAASGRVEVKVVAKDSTEVCLMVTNKTDRPLGVVLPAAFAAVPALAQFAWPGQNQPAAQQAPQPLAVANRQAWPPGALANVPPNPGPLWNIAPEKVGRVVLPAVCLEYGRPNPRAKFAYEVRPLEEVTARPGVARLVEMLGRGEIGQRAAQLAAWHLNNDMSWARLAGLRQRASIGTLPLFARADLDAARRAVEELSESGDPSARETGRDVAGESAIVAADRADAR